MSSFQVTKLNNIPIVTVNKNIRNENMIVNPKTDTKLLTNSHVLNSSISTMLNTMFHKSTLQETSGTFQGTDYFNQFAMNQETNDAMYWLRENPSFYLLAQTFQPHTTASASLTTLEPNQSVYLFAYQPNKDVPSNTVTWYVNSQTATITPDTKSWHMNNNEVGSATFTASKPGVYTIQAEQNGEYSVPFVLTVGLDQLPYTPMPLSTTIMGIASLPTNLVPNQTITQSSVTYSTYTPQGDWIPIEATTTLPNQAMNVMLQTASGQSWNYRLPVIHGQVQAMIESPYQGNVTVTYFPNYFATLTNSVQTGTGYSYPDISYTVQVNGPALGTQQTALLASAHRDYNLTPQMDQIAATLLENSPTIDTAIEAISNEASNWIRYNTSELQTINYKWQDVGSAWAAQSGVCEDYSNAAAAMLERVGIPTQTILGYADSTWTQVPSTGFNQPDNHQWDQAWDGSNWVVFDPTWATDDASSLADLLTNEFFTSTTSLITTHLTDTNQIGTYYATHTQVG